MTRASVLATGAVLGALVLAGCGTPPHYSLDKTRSCLEAAGAKIVAPKGDFVAATATAGTFRAELGGALGNAVTISFGNSGADAQETADGYVRFHAKNVGISDVLSVDKNVVLLWKQHPTDAELSTVTGCLK